MKPTKKGNLETKDVMLSEIIFNEKLYPRKEHDPKLVQQYADVMEEIEAKGLLVPTRELIVWRII